MLKEAALAAVDALIEEHGLPWRIGSSGLPTADSDGKARALLALAFVESYGLGLTVMRDETERVFAEMREQLR